MKLKWLVAFTCTGLMSCGGGSGGGGSSGVDSNKTIAELSDGEVMDLCEYIASTLPSPPREIDCGDGNVITLGIDAAELEQEIADCTAEVANLPDCIATVGDAEACAEGSADTFASLSDAEICDVFMGGTPPPSPAACEALDDPTCSGGQV